MEENSNIQIQLNTILSELSNLKQEVQGTNANVATEVRKLKKEKDLVFRFQGNKVQYDFNAELEDTLKQAQWALENNKFEHCKEQLDELQSMLHRRNKLIRIADTSSGGWETVRQYESNPVASDSDDENKIYKAESRAISKKKRSSIRGKRDYASSASATVSSYNASVGLRSWGAQAPQPSLGRGRFFRPQFSLYYDSRTGSSYGGPTAAPGPCFACGEFSHFRRNCPHVRAAGVAAITGDQSAAPRK